MKTNQVNTESTATYNKDLATPINFKLVQNAISELKKYLREPGKAMESPELVKDYLRLHLADLERECFALLVLDTKHRVIEYVPLFWGTIDAASVYPREVVKAVLQLNGAAVILAHNHPSGEAEPSQADRDITDRLKEALKLIDVKLLDHIVIGGDAELNAVSFADRGWV